MHQPRVGVGVFILKEGKFLMGRRVGKHATNTWSLPGGWLEFNESFEEAAQREVKEETGVVIAGLRPAAVSDMVIQREDIHSVVVWMIGEWIDGVEQVIEPDKFVDLRWVDFETLPSPLFPAWEQLLQSDFLQGIMEAVEGSRR